MAGHSPVATVSFKAFGDVAARRIVRLRTSKGGEAVQADADSARTAGERSRRTRTPPEQRESGP